MVVHQPVRGTDDRTGVGVVVALVLGESALEGRAVYELVELFEKVGHRLDGG